MVPIRVLFLVLFYPCSIVGFRVAFMLVSIWVLFGFDSGSFQVLSVFYVGLIWFLVGFYVVSILGFISHLFVFLCWVRCVFYLGSICVLCWFYLDSVCISFGFDFGSMQVICVFYVFSSWVSFGVYFGFFIWSLLGLYLFFILGLMCVLVWFDLCFCGLCLSFVRFFFMWV